MVILLIFYFIKKVFWIILTAAVIHKIMQLSLLDTDKNHKKIQKLHQKNFLLLRIAGELYGVKMDMQEYQLLFCRAVESGVFFNIIMLQSLNKK